MSIFKHYRTPITILFYILMNTYNYNSHVINIARQFIGSSFIYIDIYLIMVTFSIHVRIDSVNCTDLICFLIFPITTCINKI